MIGLVALANVGATSKHACACEAVAFKACIEKIVVSFITSRFERFLIDLAPSSMRADRGQEGSADEKRPGHHLPRHDTTGHVWNDGRLKVS